MDYLTVLLLYIWWWTFWEVFLNIISFLLIDRSKWTPLIVVNTIYLIFHFVVQVLNSIHLISQTYRYVLQNFILNAILQNILQVVHTIRHPLTRMLLFQNSLEGIFLTVDLWGGGSLPPLRVEESLIDFLLNVGFECFGESLLQNLRLPYFLCCFITVMVNMIIEVLWIVICIVLIWLV